MNFSFLALILTLLGMAFLTNWNKHVLFLMAVSSGLWATMIWFVAEITRVQTQPQNAPPPMMDGSIPSASARTTADLLTSRARSSATESGQARQRRG
ncbi:hypothetical protein NCC49_000951 [Naganishia albida]|nr:hypothetical protein NCC49_000951 [Naganishia albida]